MKLSVQGLYGPIWGLSKTGGSSYSLWQSIAPGQSFDFVYIHAAPQATISVQSYDMN